MKACLVFGCFGRKHNDFQICSGIENEILDITTRTEINTDIVEHLDNVYHLFDRPLYSNVHTALFSIQDNFSQEGKPIFPLEYFKNLEEFCTIHAKCGLFLRLKLRDD